MVVGARTWIGRCGWSFDIFVRSFFDEREDIYS
jgi:hypothetical protein